MKKYKIKLSDGSFIFVEADSSKIWDDGDLTLSKEGADQFLVISRGQWILIADTEHFKI